MSQIIIFWSNGEIKMHQNITFRLNRENKIPQNPKIYPKNREIKMPRKVLALALSSIDCSHAQNI